MRTGTPVGQGRSGIGQIILLDLVAVGLEQHRGAAQLADLLFGPFDHPVTLVGLLIKHLPAGRHLEALFGARLGLELGHLALLCGDSHGLMSGRPDFARLSVLIVHFPSPRQPFRPGGVMAEAGAKYNRYPGSCADSGLTRSAASRPSLEPSLQPWGCMPGHTPFWRPLARAMRSGSRESCAAEPEGPQLRPCLADEASGRPATAFRSCRSRPNLAGVGPVRQAPRRPRPDAQAADSAALTWSARMPGSSVTGLRPKPQYAASPNSGRYLRANATRCRNRSILWIAPR